MNLIAQVYQKLVEQASTELRRVKQNPSIASKLVEVEALSVRKALLLLGKEFLNFSEQLH
jgi:hypothetical protein